MDTPEFFNSTCLQSDRHDHKIICKILNSTDKNRRKKYIQMFKKWTVKRNNAGFQLLSNHQEKTAIPLRFYKGQHEMCCRVIEIKL